VVRGADFGIQIEINTNFVISKKNIENYFFVANANAARKAQASLNGNDYANANLNGKGLFTNDVT